MTETAQSCIICRGDVPPCMLNAVGGTVYRTVDQAKTQAEVYSKRLGFAFYVYGITVVVDERPL